MAQKRVVRTRRRRRSKVEEPVEEAEVEEVEQEDEEDEEEVDEQPTRRRRRRRISKTEEPEDDEEVEELPLPAVQLDEDDEDDEEVEERPRRRARKVDEKPKKKVGGRQGDRTKTDEEMAAAEAEPDPEPVSRLPKSVEVLMKDAFITDILDVLEDGQTLLITRKNKDTWEMRTKHQAGKLLVAEEKDFGLSLSGKEYWDEVLNPEWKAWADEWNARTTEEKIKYAKDNKIEWEEHDSEKITKMRLGTAVVEHLGINKYKPEYESPSARRRIRA